MPKKLCLSVIAGLAVTLTVVMRSVAEDEESPIKDLMTAQMKGKEAPIQQAIKGELGKEELDELVKALKTLPSLKPPQGPADGWKKKTEALAKAAEAVQKGESGAGMKLKDAANCKACHDIHKPKPKS